MNIEKRVRFGLLLDFYGNMLTEKQLSISKKYFEEDIALVEIAEEFGISRQAVLDTIKKSEQQLESFERELQLVSRHNCLKEKLSDVIHDLENSENLDQVLNKLKGLYQYL